MNIPWMAIAPYAAVVLGGAVVGALLIPGFAFAFAKSMKLEGLARVFWTIGSLSSDHAELLLENEDGSYSSHLARPADPDAEYDAEYLSDEGDWRPLTTDARWTRLGKRPFGVAAKPNPQTIPSARRYEDLAEMAGDGGIPTQERSVGEEWIPQGILKRLEDAGGWLVKTRAVRTPLHGQGGADGSFQAKRDAKAKYGGTGEISQKWVAIGVCLMFLGSALLGLLFFGGA